MSTTLLRSRRRIPRRTDLWPRSWRRKPAHAAILLLVAVVVAWSRLHAPSGTDFDRYHNKTFTCLRAVDGDTVDIATADNSHDYTRIRLWGVDTPETARSDTGAMHFGPEASGFTHALVDGKSVRVVLSSERTRDKYGRLLAYVYIVDGGHEPANLGSASVPADAMLNERLIAGGYAYADRRFPHVWRERFASLEEKARKKGLGLWKNVRLEQMPKWRQRYEEWKAGEPPLGDEEME